METLFLVLGVAGLVVGLGGLLYGKRQAHLSSRGRLKISLQPRFEFVPERIAPDFAHVVSISFAGGGPIGNLSCFDLSVELVGYNDHLDEGMRQPPKPGEPRRPCIEFENFTVISIGTQNNDPDVFEIPLGRSARDTVLFINVIRLRAGCTARFSIIGTKPVSCNPVVARLRPGHIKNIDIRRRGMLVE